MNFAAVILAGGKSSRMGRDKAWLEVQGKPLLARQIDLVREIGAAEIFISGRSENDYSAFGCQVLTDRFPEAGPLAGIERALATASRQLLLVLAVDLPAMPPAFLQKLAAVCSEQTGVIPRLEGNVEPLAAFYPKATLPLAESLLQAGQNSVASFGRSCVQRGHARFVKVLPGETRYFTNWNTPGDCLPA